MSHEKRKASNSSRRGFLKKAAAGAAAVAAGGTVLANDRHDRDRGHSSLCDGARDLALVNGRFLTMDRRNSIARAVAIKDGRIVKVGGHGEDLGPCERTIDLRGATVIPGLNDSHVHFLRAGQLPGYQVRIIETATSIAELQQMISQRAKTVPPGQFITNVGGWNTNGLAEKRLPTVAELDAAAPSHPVYLSTTGAGGAVTNSSGRAFFTSRGVVVQDNGTLNAGQALAALQAVQTESDRQRSTADLMDFASSLGVTMVTDMGTSGAAVEGIDGYRYALNLWREGDLKVRLRSMLNSSDDGTFAVAEARVTNSFRRVGDDVFRTNGVGERVNSSPTNPGYVDFCRFAAERGWTVTQHSLTAAEISFHLSAFQAAKAVAPIDQLRWSLDHLNPIDDAQIAAAKALGIGLRLQGWNYTSANPSGPPWRKLVDSGIPLGAGTDSTNVGAFNPWLMIYFMSTMKNNAGTAANPPDQKIMRLEALRMYTIGSAYFSFDDDKLGSIEAGKLADLAVLSDDPLTVSDDKLRKLQSVLTLQAGKVVHGRLGGSHHGHRND